MTDEAVVQRAVRAACEVHFRHIPNSECIWPKCHRPDCRALGVEVRCALNTALPAPVAAQPQVEPSDLERSRTLFATLADTYINSGTSKAELVEMMAAEFAAARRAGTTEGWDAAIRFVESGVFLHNDAPGARMARECATEMRKRDPIKLIAANRPGTAEHGETG